MITSAIDEITSISVNIFTKDKYLPSSTDIHTTFHRPLSEGKVPSISDTFSDVKSPLQKAIA